MKRWILACVLGLVASIALVTPAQAAFTDCPNGTSCVWLEANGTGSRFTVSVGSNGVNVCHNMPWGFNNTVTSVLDGYGSGLDLLLYSTSNCTTPAVLVWIPPADFGQWNFTSTAYNNVMSSYIIYPRN